MRKKFNLIALDLETGGLNPNKNGIITVSALCNNGRAFHAIVEYNPKLIYEKEALAINGFTPLDIEDTFPKQTWWFFLENDQPRIERGEKEKTVLENLINFHKENEPFITIGSNPNFDIGFLKEACRRNAPEIEKKMGYLFFRRTIDLKNIAFLAYQANLIDLETKNGFPSLSLDAIAKSLGRKRGTAKHLGQEDCSLTLELYEKLSQLLLEPHLEKTRILTGD